MRLETDRLILREWEVGDRGPLAAILGNAEVMRFYPATRTRQEADAWIDWAIAGLKRDGFGFLAVERKADGAFLGQIGIARYAYAASDVSNIEIGWIRGAPFLGPGLCPRSGARLPPIWVLAPRYPRNCRLYLSRQRSLATGHGKTWHDA